MKRGDADVYAKKGMKSTRMMGSNPMVRKISKINERSEEHVTFAAVVLFVPLFAFFLRKAAVMGTLYCVSVGYLYAFVTMLIAELSSDKAKEKKTKPSQKSNKIC